MTPTWLSTNDLDLMLNAAGPDIKRRVLAHIAALDATNAALVRVINLSADREQGCLECGMIGHHFLECVTGRISREPHPGAALLEEHRKALARARNEGLERAAAKADAVADEARRRRDAIDTNTPMGRTGYTVAETAMDTAGVLADDIRALKEPEE